MWRGRFKAFPIQEDEHLLTVLRDIERNALRAALVGRAENWRWSSLPWWLNPGSLPFLDPGPLPRPADWPEHVNRPATEKELERLRQSVQRGCPYGADPWVRQTASDLGLDATLRSRGRPRKRQQDLPHQATLFAEE